MRVTFLTVGKPTKSWASEAVAHYSKFLSKYVQIGLAYIKPVSGRNTSDDEVSRLESERLLDKFHSTADAVIVCDSRGKTMTSEQLSQTLRDLLDTHGGHATVVIGGACGVANTVLSRADFVLSFGPMTFPHDLALVVAMEQVARAFSISRGESYHK